MKTHVRRGSDLPDVARRLRMARDQRYDVSPVRQYLFSACTWREWSLQFPTRTPAIAVVVGLLASISGCSVSPTIHAEANPMVNFSLYRTYAWAAPNSSLEPPPAALPLGGMQDWRIRNAVEANLGARGWTPSANPGVLVAYGVAVHEMNTSSFSEYARYVQEGGREGLGPAFVTGYQQGTLYLDLYDSTTRQLVWHASATAVIGSGDNSEVVRTAVQMMLAKLPSQ